MPRHDIPISRPLPHLRTLEAEMVINALIFPEFSEGETSETASTYQTIHFLGGSQDRRLKWKARPPLTIRWTRTYEVVIFQKKKRTWQVFISVSPLTFAPFSLGIFLLWIMNSKFGFHERTGFFFSVVKTWKQYYFFNSLVFSWGIPAFNFITGNVKSK